MVKSVHGGATLFFGQTTDEAVGEIRRALGIVAHGPSDFLATFERKKGGAQQVLHNQKDIKPLDKARQLRFRMDLMNIESGLMPNQVLQRDAKGRATARICGTIKTGVEGEVTVRVRCRGRMVKGFNGQRIGAARDGIWIAVLKGLLTGGPYEITFEVGRSARVKVLGILVGDVWFLGGQSNMHGVGNVEDALPPHPMVHAFYNWDEWGVAEEPLTFFAGAVDPIHNPTPLTDRAEILRAKKKEIKGVGPGLAFGREMFRRTGVPQGLVCCAHGGTSMDQWSPDLKDQGGKSLYGAMYRRFAKLGQPAAGLLWYQGESDAGVTEPYTRKMQALVVAVRRDFGQPRLPWIVVQISRFHPIDSNPLNPGWVEIREQQRRFPETIPHLSVVPAIDLPMDDGIHISATGHVTLAARMARAACFQLKQGRGVKDAIRLRRIRLVPSALNRGADVIEVTFDNVTGELWADGVPAGFRLIAPDGSLSRRIHKTICRGNRVFLEAYIDSDPSMKGYRLAYGYEIDAYCNIHDCEGMGLPAFGPQPIER